MKSVVNDYFKVKNESIIDYCYNNEVSTIDDKLAYFLLEQENFFIYGDPIQIIEKNKYYKISLRDLEPKEGKEVLDSAINTCKRVVLYTGNRINSAAELLECLRIKRHALNNKGPVRVIK